jgi:hypothetical protein
VGKRRKTDKRRAPAEVQRLKRDLGLDRQFLRSLPNFVRLEKTGAGGLGPNGGQLIGPDAQAVISFQEAQRNIGGGADIANNAFKVPTGRTGLWAIRVALHLSSASVDPNSNYRVACTRNGTEFIEGSNQTSATRAVTARAEDERFLDEGDVIKVEMQNNTDATQPSPNVEVLDTSHVTFRFLGTVEE